MVGIEWSLLQDRSVLITGGASGLGEATAIKFHSHGAYVTIADVADSQGQNLASKLGSKATYVQCDTTNWDESVAAFKHAASFAPSKTVDIVVLFAGLGGENKSLLDIVLEDTNIPQNPPGHKAIDVNLIGVYYSTYLALHYFSSRQKEATKASLVLISSMAGYIDFPYNTGYTASKFGVRAVFRSIRSQGSKVNARINNIAPGYIATPLTMSVHGIDNPKQPSKKTGQVLPWAPIDYVVDGVGKCAVEEIIDGRTFAIAPSGVVDMQEDFENGYGGLDWTRLMHDDGFTKMPSLFPNSA